MEVSDDVLVGRASDVPAFDNSWPVKNDRVSTSDEIFSFWLMLSLSCLIPVLVGVRGLEPPTSASRTLRASHLRYTPIDTMQCFFANANALQSFLIDDHLHLLFEPARERLSIDRETLSVGA